MVTSHVVRLWSHMRLTCRSTGTAGEEMRRQSRVVGRRSLAALGAVMTVTLLLASCGGSKSGSSGETDLKAAGLSSKDGEPRLKDAGKPVRGGKLIYGVEADSPGY